MSKSNNEAEQSPEFLRALSDLIDGRLTEEGRCKLQDCLLNNEAAQSTYEKLMTVHALLHLDFGQGYLHLLPPVLSSHGLSEVVPTNGASANKLGMNHARSIDVDLYQLENDSFWGWGSLRSRGWKTLSMAVMLAACLLVAATTWWFASPGQTRDTDSDRPSFAATRKRPAKSRPIRQEGVDNVAVLSQATGAVWSVADVPTEVGESFQPGRFRLDQGLIQIEFKSGAVAVLEGPADFEIISAKLMVCRLGKIRAHVPSQAEGFTIDTPAYSAIDLGTEFTVQVAASGETDFHVLEGEVKLREMTGEENPPTELLTEGEGARTSTEGELSKLQPEATPMVGRQQLLELSEAAQKKRFEAWLHYSSELREDPRLLCYYGFDGHANWERQLRNVGPQQQSILDGAIVGCQWTTGRWSDKRALEFKRTIDRVRLSVPGEFDSLTFFAWVRIEGLEHRFNSLFLTDGHDLGEVHWQITDFGRLLLGVKAEAELSHDFRSPPVIGPADLGRWVHLACVYDAENGVVRHYLDGNEVSSESIKIPVKLRIGPSDLGNWSPEHYTSNRLRSLNGRIDEFGVYNVALSADQIYEIFAAGKPRL